MKTLSPQPDRVLVLASENADSGELGALLLARAARARTEILVVAPALNTPLRHWLSDEDGARRRADERLLRCVEELRRAGVVAEGLVGDPDPVQAAADALALFDADVLVIATGLRGRPYRLERGLVERARRRFRLPVLHVSVGQRLPAAA